MSYKRPTYNKANIDYGNLDAWGSSYSAGSGFSLIHQQKVASTPGLSNLMNGVDATSGAAYQAAEADYNAAKITNTINDAKLDILGLLGKGDDPADSYPEYPIGGGTANYIAPSTPQKLSYIDAPYAELYGMDASTAYQEALANTAYQRKVKDLKAAGLNPVLGYSGAGAASFYGTPDAGVSSSGGVSYGSSGSGKTTDGLSDKQRDTLIRNLPTAIGGVIGIVNPKVGNAVTTIGNAFGNIVRYW